MLNLSKRRTIDLLVEQFWKQGYLTVSRKFGTYLPEPTKVGKFDVDIVARQKDNYAIGITLTSEDLHDQDLLTKLSYLATRQTKFSNRRVMLFVGVPIQHYSSLKEIIASLPDDTRRNIKLFQIFERPIPKSTHRKVKQGFLFS
jgi:hypothetical protein